MTAKDLYRIYILYNPEMASKTVLFTEDNTKKNTIKLVFNNGRKGTFTVERGKFKLILEDE